MKTIKEWVLESYERQEIEDITKHGCCGGIGGLIYYTETVAFHDEFEEQIWDRLHYDAEEQDLTIMELIASFNAQKDVGSMTQLKNLLTWYAVESVCNEIINETE